MNTILKKNTIPFYTLNIRQLQSIIEMYLKLRHGYHEYTDILPFKNIPRKFKVYYSVKNGNVFLCLFLLCYFNPKSIDYWVITKILGCGKFSCILELRNTFNDNIRALKVVPFIHIEEEEVDFKKECELLYYIQSINNSSYAPIIYRDSIYINKEEKFGSFTMEKIKYTLEYAATLRIRRNESPFLKEEIDRLLDILIDLNYTHDITHNDVNLGNIGFKDNGKLCLLDFGFAYTLDHYIQRIKPYDILYNMVKNLYIKTVYKYISIYDFSNFIEYECSDFMYKHKLNSETIEKNKQLLINTLLEKLNNTTIGINKGYAKFLFHLSYNNNSFYKKIKKTMLKHNRKIIEEVEEACNVYNLGYIIFNITHSLVFLNLAYVSYNELSEEQKTNL